MFQQYWKLIYVSPLGKTILGFLFHWIKSEVEHTLKPIDPEDFERNFRKEELFFCHQDETLRNTR